MALSPVRHWVNQMSGASKKLMSAAGAGGESFWITRLNGGRLSEEYTGIAVNEAGEVFCAGKSGTNPYNNATFTALNADGSVSFGKDIGARNTGNPDDDYYQDLDIAPDGNLFACGLTHDAIQDFGIVSKIAPDGTLVWSSGMKGVNLVRGIASDTSSNVYGMLMYGDKLGVFKLSSTGASVWRGEYALVSGNVRPANRGVASDSSGNLLVVAAISYRNDSFPRWPYDDSFLAKFNSSGTKQWDIKFTTVGANNCRLSCVATDSSDNVYVAGTGATSLGTYIAKFVMKINAAGTIQWQKSVGSLGPGPNAIKIDNDGNIILFGNDTGGSLAADAAYAIKLDSAGNLVWARYIDAADNQVVFGGAVDASNNVYMSGYYLNDYFVAKLPADGSGTGTYTNFVYESFTPTVAATTISSTTSALASQSGTLLAFTTGITLSSAAQTYTQTIDELVI